MVQVAQITSPPPPPPPHFGQVVHLFLDVKNNVFARNPEPSNDDYDNGVSDNCDHNFGTFDDFGVKNYQKVSNNMILMSLKNIVLLSSKKKGNKVALLGQKQSLQSIEGRCRKTC